MLSVFVGELTCFENAVKFNYSLQFESRHDKESKRYVCRDDNKQEIQSQTFDSKCPRNTLRRYPVQEPFQDE